MGPEEVIEILGATACQSSDACSSCTVEGGCPEPFIGGLPNGDWGFGKLNVLGAVTEAARRGATGFPTRDPTDGKIVDVVGSAPITFPDPLFTLFIETPESSPDISVDIFDGDLGGAFDVLVEPTTTYFTLYPDPFETCGLAPGTEIAQETDSFFEDNAYITLFSGSDETALNAGAGSYHYRLEVALGDPVAPDPAAMALNGFKVRVTQPAGQTGARLVSLCAPFQFIGVDAAPPPPLGFTSPNPILAGPAGMGVDTSYDGNFDWFIDVPTLVSDTLVFHDADADDTDNPDGACAIGQNSAIRYFLFTPTGSLDHQQEVVSGDYSSCTGLTSAEDVSVPNAGAGFYRWRWSDMLTENQVHVEQPVPGASFPLRLLPAPFFSLPVSAARGIGFWRNTDDDLSPLLPIVLGELSPEGDRLGQTVVVTTDEQARQVLTRGGGRVDPGTRAVRNLRSQLLAAKLNMAAAVALGEDFAAARIHGTDFFVGEVAEQSKEALAAIDDPTTLAAEERAALTELQDLLSMANEAQVSFLVDPTAEAPADPPAPPGTPAL
jgi:hypothetical protein